jgi:Lrp/AsnC family transcriptional regulator, regulator for asnA, asnC and gidA
MSKNFKSKLDEVDRRIINILLEDAQMPYAEVAKKAFVSSGTIHVRLKKLKGLGVIKGVQIKIDYSRLGYDVKAFLGIYLEKSVMYDDVLGELTNIPEITNIDYTTGNYAMFVTLLCEDTNHLRKVLHEKIQKVEGISRTETIISLNEDVNRNIEVSE